MAEQPGKMSTLTAALYPKSPLSKINRMKSTRIFALLLGLVLVSQLILQQSCKKNGTTVEPVYLTVNLPRSVFHNETYYSLKYQERSIELDFSQPVDSTTIPGNITFSDKGGPLEMMYRTISQGKKVIISLPANLFPDSILKD